MNEKLGDYSEMCIMQPGKWLVVMYSMYVCSKIAKTCRKK